MVELVQDIKNYTVVSNNTRAMLSSSFQFQTRFEMNRAVSASVCEISLENRTSKYRRLITYTLGHSLQSLSHHQR